jgi:methylmalonyl-CoA mutase, C-terminal domain
MPRKIRVLVGKPGLDGHDRGAKVVAAALRDAGMEVIYTGLHQTPAQIVEAALQEDVDVVALSILSGAHMTLFPEVLELMKSRGLDDKLLTGGGIIPAEDMQSLSDMGVGKLFGPGASTQDIAVYIRAWFVGVHGQNALEPIEMPRPPEVRPVVPARAEVRHHDAPKVTAKTPARGTAKPPRSGSAKSARPRTTASRPGRPARAASRPKPAAKRSRSSASSRNGRSAARSRSSASSRTASSRTAARAPRATNRRKAARARKPAAARRGR